MPREWPTNQLFQLNHTYAEFCGTKKWVLGDPSSVSAGLCGYKKARDQIREWQILPGSLLTNKLLLPPSLEADEISWTEILFLHSVQPAATSNHSIEMSPILLNHFRYFHSSCLLLHEHYGDLHCNFFWCCFISFSLQNIYYKHKHRACMCIYVYKVFTLACGCVHKFVYTSVWAWRWRRVVKVWCLFRLHSTSFLSCD